MNRRDFFRSLGATLAVGAVAPALPPAFPRTPLLGIDGAFAGELVRIHRSGLWLVRLSLPSFGPARVGLAVDGVDYGWQERFGYDELRQELRIESMLSIPREGASLQVVALGSLAFDDGHFSAMCLGEGAP